jgi:hypothetical protein
MDLKKNSTLIIGIAIPIVMIILVAASIYVPMLFAHPKYSFLYVSGDEYNSEYIYRIHNGALVKEKRENEKGDNLSYGRSYNGEQKLFYHDIEKNESREISFEEAKNLNLNTNVKSPDGFEIMSGWQDGGIFPFFMGRSHSGQYIKKNSFSKELKTQSSDDYYYYDFHFLGWVIN